MDWVRKLYIAQDLPQWHQVHVGVDYGSPEGDYTTICLRGRNVGKSALAKEIMREAKRKGYRVVVMETKS